MYPLPLQDPDDWVHSEADFSPDGQYLVFARGKHVPINLYTCRLDGSELRRLTNYYPALIAQDPKQKKPPVVVARTAAPKKTAVASRPVAKKPTKTTPQRQPIKQAIVLSNARKETPRIKQAGIEQFAALPRKSRLSIKRRKPATL